MSKFLFGVMLLAAAPASAQQAAGTVQTAPAPVTGAPTTTPPAPATPPATAPVEVAAILAREFPAYDKDANGGLSAGEFNDWMLRLKTIADPSLQADAPSTRTWLNAAFRQADTDRSRAVTLAELTGFLSAA